ncbi:MAG: glycosyltransferase family 2 protein [Planctomycetota bacterium]
MMWTFLAVIGLLMATLPAAMFLRNLNGFRSLPSADDARPSAGDKPLEISILIPARDEAGGIAAAIDAALAATGANVEVVVLDDHSTDGTLEILQAKSAADPRVRFASSQPLPESWNGKQYACYQLSKLARHPVWVFLDADVRLQPTALLQMETYRQQQELDLLSIFPKQITGTISEKMIIPLMHYVLLGFLPMDRMRSSRSPAFASGCGQVFMTTANAYAASGTHEAIASSRHDGLKLPAAYRKQNLKTDVMDGTELASVRMYTNTGEVIRGVLKNATEGIASPRLIVPFSCLLIGANVLPWVTLVAGLLIGSVWTWGISILAILIGLVPRALAAIHFQQSWIGTMLQSPAIVLFVTLQWVALINHLFGRQVAWRGRT